MKGKTGIVIIGLFIGFSACQKGNDQKDDTQNSDELIIARAFDKTLTESEFNARLQPFNSLEDSLFFAKRIVDDWMNRQILLHYAKKNLSDSLLQKEKQLQQYLDDLILYELHNQLAADSDTTLPDSLILQYYNENKQNFELKENIVKLRFFKFPKELKDLDKYYNWFASGTEENQKKLAKIAEEKNGNSYLDSSWLSFNDILKEIPIVTYNQEHFLNNNKVFRLTGNQYVYFVQILDFKIKNNISPLAFERERIKTILLNKRRKQLLRSREKELVSKALNNGDAEIY